MVEEEAAPHVGEDDDVHPLFELTAGDVGVEKVLEFEIEHLEEPSGPALIDAGSPGAEKA